MMYSQLLVCLCLQLMLWGIDTSQLISVKPLLYPATTSRSPTNANNSHHRDVSSKRPTSKKVRCNKNFLDGCRCSQNAGSFSISCYNAQLGSMPKLDFGPSLVRSLNLEYNNLTKIKVGDFFGLKIENLYLGRNCLRRFEFLAFWGLEYHLEVLDVSYNSFSRTPATALKLLRNLKILKLSGNKITVLYGNDFQALQKLHMLFLDANPIRSIQKDAFHGCTAFLLNLNKIKLRGGLADIPTADLGHLQRLRLANNNIESIPEGWFRGLVSLRFLDLEHNKLRHLQDGDFSGLSNSLRKLNLRKNKLRRVPSDALQGLSKLEYLDLSSNNIRKIQSSSFNSSLLLKELNLRHNRINNLHRKALLGLNSINEIDLRDNELVYLDERTFPWDKPTKRQVFLSNNLWVCNCLMKWIKREHRDRTPLSKVLADISSLKCDKPSSLKGKAIVKVPLSQFTCDHGYYYYVY